MACQQESFGGHTELSVFHTEPPPPYPVSSVHTYPTPGGEYSHPTYSSAQVTNPVTVAMSGTSQSLTPTLHPCARVRQNVHEPSAQLLYTDHSSIALMLML